MGIRYSPPPPVWPGFIPPGHRIKQALLYNLSIQPTPADIEFLINIYMVRLKARQYFQVNHGKIDLFAEAGRKNYAVLHQKKRRSFQIKEQTT